MCYIVSLSPVTGAKWDKQKWENYNSDIEKSEKSLLKLTRIEQMPEFCNKIMYLLTWNRAYIYNKINISKPLPKHLHINVKKQQTLQC